MHIRNNHDPSVDNERRFPCLFQHLALFVSQSIFMINFFTQNSCVRRLELRQSHMFSILVYLSGKGTHTKSESHSLRTLRFPDVPSPYRQSPQNNA